ncbi:MAG: PEP-utilizing enzyme [Acidimicrobiales bacterium]
MDTTWDPPGPGPWQQDRAHNPISNTRLMVEAYPQSFERGFEEAFARYGSLLDRLAMGVVNGFIYHQVQPFDMPGPDGPPSPDEIGAEIGRRAGVAEAALENRIWRDDIERWDNDLKPAAVARHMELYAVDLGALDDEELGAHLTACVEHLEAMVHQHHRFNVSATFPVGDFLLTVAPWVNRPPDSMLSVFGGYSDVSGAIPPEMAPLVEIIRNNVDAQAILDGAGDASERLAALVQLVPEVSTFLAVTGYRLVDVFDVTNPTLGERPELVLGKLAGALQVDPLAARAAGDEAAASLRAGLDPDQQMVFDEKLADARALYRLRDERGIYSDVSAIGLVRLAMLEIGRRAVAAGQLDSAELVLDATASELLDLLAGAGPTSDELAAWAHTRTTLTRDDAPRLLGPPPPEPPPTDGLPPALARVESSVGFVINGILGELDEPVGDAQTIGGISASAGVYEGSARHVMNIDDLFTIEPGDVLIAPTTGEAFNAIIHLVGAIVTDHGSFASHAGIVAREMGFPAVVGTTNATDRIPPGASVRVDGDSGQVILLS